MIISEGNWKEKNNVTSILCRFDQCSKQRRRGGEDPVVNSRYSIVMATSKRARQIIAGDEQLVDGRGKKALSVAVEELNQSKIKILSEEEKEEETEAEA